MAAQIRTTNRETKRHPWSIRYTVLYVNVLCTQHMTLCTIYRDLYDGKGMPELFRQWVRFLLVSFCHGSLDNLDRGQLMKESCAVCQGGFPRICLNGSETDQLQYKSKTASIE
jgi:hypothetical protein